MKYLEQTIKCLLNQDMEFDVINVYLNDYAKVPYFLKHEKINAVIHPEGDLKASGKFYFLDDFEGVYITCDDDLFYPKDYVRKIYTSLEKYNFEVVAGIHGTCYVSLPVQSYYHSQKLKYHYRTEVKNQVWVDMLGTGTMGFHTKIGINRSIFEHPNMCDPQLMKFLIENEIPQLSLSRPKNYIYDHVGSQLGACIWKDVAYKGDKIQTDIVNSIENYKVISYGV